MLKVDIDGKGPNHIEFSGSGEDLTVAICSLIHAITKRWNRTAHCLPPHSGGRCRASSATRISGL